jgi:hypothetical protein
MKLTKEELNGFPLQPGIRPGRHFEVYLADDGRRLIITCDSMTVIPHEYLRYGAYVYRFEELTTTVVENIDVAIELTYTAT